jgi:hypothetical protein
VCHMCIAKRSNLHHQWKSQYKPNSMLIYYWQITLFQFWWIF